MNREEILALSDDEINRLIATKWMGWTLEGNAYFSDEVVLYANNWSPSTSISDAMEALEKFRVKKIFSEIKLGVDGYVIVIHKDLYNIIVGYDEISLPKAICQCILLYLNEMRD